MYVAVAQENGFFSCILAQFAEAGTMRSKAARKECNKYDLTIAACF